MNMLLAKRSQWRFWIKILVMTQFHDKLQLLSVSEPRGHMWVFLFLLLMLQYLAIMDFHLEEPYTLLKTRLEKVTTFH